MFLHSLKIDNYKNLEKFKLSFNKKINCFIGKNGIGKTNIVDSIYHLAFTKSYFNPRIHTLTLTFIFFIIKAVSLKEKKNVPKIHRLF